MSFTLAVIVALAGVVLLYFGATRSYQQDLTRQLAADGPRTLPALAEALGMTLGESRSLSVLVFDDEVAMNHAQLRVVHRREGRPNVSLWTVSSITLEVFVGSDTLTFTSRGGGHASGEGLLPGLDRSYVFEGSEDEAMVSFAPPIVRAINALWTRDPDPVSSSGVYLSGWHGVQIDDSIQVFGLSMSSHRDRVCHLVRDWPALRARVESLVRAWGERSDVPTSLLERLVDEQQSIERRWQSATALLNEHADSEATAKMRAQADALPEWVRLACAVSLWEPGVTYGSVAAALTLDVGDMRRDLGRRLGARFPWEVFLDPNATASLRDDVFDAAMAAAPDERGDAFVGLLVSALDASENRASLYERLRASGWEPSHEARARLARDAVASIRHELVRELRGREVTLDDAPMLAALMRNGHEGDVAPYVEIMSEYSEMGGLSLAEDDAPRGGLSATDARPGELTKVDES